jgi:hypothetical protein
MFGQFQPKVWPFKSTHRRPVGIEPSSLVSPVPGSPIGNSDWTVVVSRAVAFVAPEVFEGIMASTMWFEITKPTAAARNTKHPRTGFADDIAASPIRALWRRHPWHRRRRDQPPGPRPMSPTRQEEESKRRRQCKILVPHDKLILVMLQLFPASRSSQPPGLLASLRQSEGRSRAQSRDTIEPGDSEHPPNYSFKGPEAGGGASPNRPGREPLYAVLRPGSRFTAGGFVRTAPEAERAAPSNERRTSTASGAKVSPAGGVNSKP